jgi:histidyl-tRNA synthetase
MAGGALPGFRDFYPDEFAQRAHIFRAWREVARRYALVEYDGPPLEPLELYTQKSGDEIVGQLYSFEDKGGRQVALRPEMTPTLARMVAERANALRKPVRWFSIPQLFRYERAQRGRLREHYQLNVDIVGEPTELADAELLALAIDVMRELGLGPGDVRARVSDRRLLADMLVDLDFGSGRVGAAYAALDKAKREPKDVTLKKLGAAGLAGADAARILELATTQVTVGQLLASDEGKSARVRPHLERLARYFEELAALGVDKWVDLDLSIVRGLAYYTGIVFELFDARGELRAICGGGRYDTLLESLGGADLPAVGFGMGDVVLGELLKERGLMPAASASGADLFMVGGNGALEHGIDDALSLIAHLRRAGFSVDYALNAERYKTQAARNQVDNARKSGARAVIYFESATEVVVQGLVGKLTDAPKRSFQAGPLLAAADPAINELREWFEKEVRARSIRRAKTVMEV